MSYIGYNPEHSRAFTVDSYAGTGTQQTFETSTPKPLSERGLLVVVNGIVQQPIYSYTLDPQGDVYFDEAPDLNAIITITHLGRPVDLTVPRAGSVEGQHISGDLYLPRNLYSGQGDNLYLRQDTTTPNALQSLIWDRGNQTDVYLTYNPINNTIESNVNIAGATVTSTVVDGFGEIAVQGQTTIESVNTSNIEFVAGVGMTLSTDPVTGAITFDSAAGGAISIDNLTDVSIGTPQPNQVLKWNGTFWTNAQDSTGTAGNLDLDDLQDVDAGTPTIGDTIVWDGVAWRKAHMPTEAEVKAQAIKYALIFG